MLSATDAAIIKGLLAQGHKQHDIAAHFGENSGRIADIKTGKKFADIKPFPLTQLPKIAVVPPRFIDPKASLDEQISQLNALMHDPPENGRWITFTPALADYILANLNNHNRRKRPRNMKRFAEAMAAGEWMRTGDTIKFNRERLLCDGQNRLAACVLSGKPFTTLVVFGIDPKAFALIDTNAIRSNSDTMQIMGVAHSNVVAHAVRWLMIGQDRGRQLTNTELHDYYREHVNAEEMQLAAARALAAGRMYPLASLAYLLYQFERKSKRTAETFANDLEHRKRGGNKLWRQIKRLREQKLGRVHELQLQAMIILAWNSYRDGIALTAKMLMWDENKEFPTIA